MKRTKRILEQLLEPISVSGYEWELGMADTLQEIVGFPGRRIGNNLVYSFSGAKSSTLFISAHMDEVGFIKTKEDKDGSQILPIGDISFAAIQNAQLIFRANNSNVISEIICSGTSFEDARIQGLSKIPAGSIGTFDKNISIEGDRIISPGLDNKVGCAALVQLVQFLQKSCPSCSIVCCFSAKEEIGTNGVLSAVRSISPDLVIDIDSAYTSRDSDIPSSWLVTGIGEGPALQLMGDKFIVSDRYRRIVENISKNNNLPLQYEVPDIYSGGTNSSSIQSAGWETIQINIPVAFQHTGKSEASISDVETASDLIIELVTSHTLFDFT